MTDALNTTDTTDMLAVHDCLRHQFGSLPLKVKAVPEGDMARTAVVGRHVLLMTAFLNAHHTSEDVLVWPLLTERSPESSGLIATMHEEHAAAAALLATAQEQATAWIATAGIRERSALHTTLIALERVLLTHLAEEERDVLPLIQRDLTPEEYAAVGVHSRAAFPPEQLAIILGLILSDTSPERGAAITGAMPPEALAGFEQFGRPAFNAYMAELTAY